MKAALQLLLGLTAFAGMMVPAAHAQAPAPPPVPDGPRYIVVYLEVMPTATAGAVTLVRQFRDATRKEAGNLRAETLQRIGQLNQFVLLEAWKDQAAADAHAKAAATAQFRDKIKAIQNAPIDERTHFPLSVGPLPAKGGGAAVAAVTHVDVIPPQRENGTADHQAARRGRPQGRRQSALRGGDPDQPAEPLHRHRAVARPQGGRRAQHGRPHARVPREARAGERRAL